MTLCLIKAFSYDIGIAFAMTNINFIHSHFLIPSYSIFLLFAGLNASAFNIHHIPFLVVCDRLKPEFFLFLFLFLFFNITRPHEAGTTSL